MRVLLQVRFDRIAKVLVTTVTFRIEYKLVISEKLRNGMRLLLESHRFTATAAEAAGESFSDVALMSCAGYPRLD